jgi:hypothetical protein
MAECSILFQINSVSQLGGRVRSWRREMWVGCLSCVMKCRRDSFFFENGSGACVRVVDREKWSVRALRRIDPRTRLFFLDVLGYIAADETPLSATDVPPSFSRTRQSYPRQPSRVLRTMERRPADPAVDSICAPVSQPW